MSKTLTTEILGLGTTLTILPGAADPSAGGGVAAVIGSLYLRSGTAQLWQKTGAANTAWTQIAVAASTPVSGTGVSWYGTGIDGNLVFDGVANVGSFAGLNMAPVANVYTLTRDIFANNITVSTGVRINPDGWRIFCLNTLTLTGTGQIAAAIGNGGNGTAGAGGAAGAVPWVTGNRMLSSGQAGGVGGPPDAGGGGPGTVPSSAINTHLGAATADTAIGGNGGVLQGGGGGGNNNNPGAGTVGNAPDAVTPFNGRYFHSIPQAVRGQDFTNVQMATGTGGSAGRGAGAGIGGGGGGGGASGPCIVVAARIITGTGTIGVPGGNGGNGLTGGGGGGGGSGGVLVVITDSAFPLSVTLNISGGVLGAQGGSAPGSTAGNGGTGMLYQFNP